jgi:hypothetical protein
MTTKERETLAELAADWRGKAATLNKMIGEENPNENIAAARMQGRASTYHACADDLKAVLAEREDEHEQEEIR